ncbi:unnamed protein product [Bursaphelenchus xylophilus]|uniref:(pine wood nematode) hypothetical protein n=1 Tax=Bursaphelenchus xylophilus TaxID=6326 RepID=A0A1I7SC89_BURXY|nr:unnamed protein product [Bursaphelenchus xylophilus]CAG9094546.1 unnamed protein product [Bursaphelenchus xylophilus]
MNLKLFLLVLVVKVYGGDIPINDKFGHDEKGTFFIANVDNFDANSTRTFFHYYNQTHYGASELNILHILSESMNEVEGQDPNRHLPVEDYIRNLPKDPNPLYPRLSDDLHKEFDANIYEIEHRYYHQSYPVQYPVTKDDFKYMSTQQALEDYRHFILEMNKKLDTQAPKWLILGGSYAGMLTIWFRQRFPELSIGAISSAGPVNVVLNFTGYMQLAQHGYEKRNPECAKHLKAAFAELKSLLNDVKSERLFELYPNLTHYDLNNKRERHLFAYEIVMDAYGQIQIDVDGICKFFNVSTPNPLEELASRFIGLADPIEDKAWGSWMWQVCNELGLFYSPDFEGSYVSGIYDVKVVFQQLCSSHFGPEFTYEQIGANVRKTREYYEQDQPYNGTNIVVTNAEYDPFSVLGLTSALDESVSFITIRNGSHCFDFRRGSLSDVVAARHIYKENIRRWMKTEDAAKIKVNLILAFIIAFLLL